MGKRIMVEIARLDDPSRGCNQSEPKRFTSLVMGLQLSKAYGPSGHVVITGGSPTLLLDDDPHTQSFSGASLQRIVKGEIGHYPVNLLRPQIDPATKESQDYVVQYKETT